MEQKNTFHLSLKYQYTLLQTLYWMSSCVAAGYAVVYLQYKGVDNVWIGIVTGGGAFLSLAAQPLVSKMAEDIRVLSVKRMIWILMFLMGALFTMVTVLPLPMAGIYACYMAVCTINCCIPGLLSAFAMEYVNQGQDLDFSLARGLGSFAYASSAVALGMVTTNFSPDVLGYIFIGFIVLFLLVISGMEEPGRADRIQQEEKQGAGKDGILRNILKNPELMCLMLGFFLCNAGNQALATYLIHLIREMGGSDTLYGIACFVCSGSELPIMMLFGWLMKKSNYHLLLKISAAAYVVKALILLTAGNIPLVLLGQAMQGIFFGLFTPATVFYVNDVMEPQNRVKGQAFFYMITVGISAGIGNLLGGWLMETVKIRGLLLVCTILGAVGFLTVVLGMMRNQKKGV